MITTLVLMGRLSTGTANLPQRFILSEKGGEPMLVDQRHPDLAQLVPVDNILPFTPRTVGLEGHEPPSSMTTDAGLLEELVSANKDLRRLVAELALCVFQLRQSFE
jgi:hypothetical protein